MLRSSPADSSYAAKLHMVRPDGAIFVFMKSDTSGLWISEQDALRDTLAEPHISQWQSRVFAHTIQRQPRNL